MSSAKPRVALVTGASQGIGAACAAALSAAGYQVALVARSAEALDEVAAGLPGEALVLPTDVLDPAALEAAFSTVESTWGPVEVLVANAGAAVSATLVKTSDEDWQRMLDLNLTAPFRCLRRALPAMTSGGWGRVVVIASVAGKQGSARIAAYAASKHGVLGLVRSAAAEVARTGVTVNAVCPGYVDTPMTDTSVANISAGTGRTPEEAREILAGMQPIGRLVTPSEVASAVMLCVENGAINGQGLNVDGGAVQS
ncbi:SDR family NAD(P)-dependent oxidoreductase [Nocardioides sp.]|uniref:SDR family NAD(P)-dependent oxidoreductase n=1 Tax=Nocardioides sp. TaxID=35761 RepID=UPI002D803666|nr:SDR family NAD(P)-dependent oxidoreductase [Nocardioides sp.]HET8959366.1 SDR family NAD(P)-dependent oxidoreductase [Nocardioides sp.]